MDIVETPIAGDLPALNGVVVIERAKGLSQSAGLHEDGVSTTVPAQSSPRPPSVAGREGPPPVPVPAVSGELQHLSEESRPPSLVGEYKQVTVLCGGLADAVALAGRLGPEAMHRRMQAVFTTGQQVLHRYA
jgi:hypothetical protein